MELMEEKKVGFEKTEVGSIPADWNSKVISEIADVKSGKRLPKGFYLQNSETPQPYIRVTDMFNGGVELSDIQYVPKEAITAITNYKIFLDDLFISVAGTLGVVGEIPSELDGANLTENANRFTNIKCDKKYLLYVLLSPLIQNKIEEERTLGAQPKLALIRIRNFSIPLPPTLEEQRAIATALSDTDTLITGLEKVISKKKAIKQGAMQ
jgi:type I restriction enzyme S subunit